MIFSIFAVAFATYETLRAYGVPLAATTLVIGLTAAVFIPTYALVAGISLGLYLRVKPLLGKW